MDALAPLGYGAPDRRRTTTEDDRVAETITLIRDGDRDLEFEGWLLGAASSYAEAKPRWFEVEIYRTAGGSYVVAGTGRSNAEGEVNRHWADVCPDAEAVVRALEREETSCTSCGATAAGRRGRCPTCGGETVPSGVRFLPRTAQLALDEASEDDPDLATAMTEKVD